MRHLLLVRRPGLFYWVILLAEQIIVHPFFFVGVLLEILGLRDVRQELEPILLCCQIAKNSAAFLSAARHCFLLLLIEQLLLFKSYLVLFLFASVSFVLKQEGDRDRGFPECHGCKANILHKLAVKLVLQWLDSSLLVSLTLVQYVRGFLQRFKFGLSFENI